MLNFAALISL